MVSSRGRRRATVDPGLSDPQPGSTVSGQEAAVKDSQERVHEPSNYILFPVAVGALFLVFLVAGALLG
jgi:hypothetical protein